ncbi:MAG: hypothetical protein ACO1NQ_00740 [Flavobacteriales bacterium]
MKSKRTSPQAHSDDGARSGTKPPGIGRSAITGRFMSVAAAKAHKKTAIVIGGRPKKNEG